MFPQIKRVQAARPRAPEKCNYQANKNERLRVTQSCRKAMENMNLKRKLRKQSESMKYSLQVKINNIQLCFESDKDQEYNCDQ